MLVDERQQARRQHLLEGLRPRAPASGRAGGCRAAAAWPWRLACLSVLVSSEGARGDGFCASRARSTSARASDGRSCEGPVEEAPRQLGMPFFVSRDPGQHLPEIRIGRVAGPFAGIEGRQRLADAALHEGAHRHLRQQVIPWGVECVLQIQAAWPERRCGVRTRQSESQLGVAQLVLHGSLAGLQEVRRRAEPEQLQCKARKGGHRGVLEQTHPGPLGGKRRALFDRDAVEAGASSRRVVGPHDGIGGARSVIHHERPPRDRCPRRGSPTRSPSSHRGSRPPRRSSASGLVLRRVRHAPGDALVPGVVDEAYGPRRQAVLETFHLRDAHGRGSGNEGRAVAIRAALGPARIRCQCPASLASLGYRAMHSERSTANGSQPPRSP